MFQKLLIELFKERWNEFTFWACQYQMMIDVEEGIELKQDIARPQT